MSNSPSPDPSKLWEVLPHIADKLRNEFLLFAFGYIILIVAIGVFAPGMVTLMGRELFYLLAVLAFLSYVGLRIMDTWAKLQNKQLHDYTAAPQRKVDTQLTGDGIKQSYTVDLKNGEILVGHATSISYAKGVYPQDDYEAVAYLIVGPGLFKFEVFNGLWDKWRNTSPDAYKQLLQEQYNVHIGRGRSPSKVQKVCLNIDGYFDCL